MTHNKKSSHINISSHKRRCSTSHSINNIDGTNKSHQLVSIQQNTLVMVPSSNIIRTEFNKLLEEIKKIDDLKFIENDDDIDYTYLLRISQFTKTYYQCDCKEILKNEIQDCQRRCELCYKDYVVRKIYYTIKNKMLNWCDVTFQDFMFDGNYVSIYGVLNFKTNKHYLDVGLKDNVPFKYNHLAQNIIAKCIYEYYLLQKFNNINYDGKQVYFHHNCGTVIVRMRGFSTIGKSRIRGEILEPSIITFY